MDGGAAAGRRIVGQALEIARRPHRNAEISVGLGTGSPNSSEAETTAHNSAGSRNTSKARAPCRDLQRLFLSASWSSLRAPIPPLPSPAPTVAILIAHSPTITDLTTTAMPARDCIAIRYAGW